MEKQRYYISTAIAYTSGKPHIGNTYEVVLADAVYRMCTQWQCRYNISAFPSFLSSINIKIKNAFSYHNDMRRRVITRVTTSFRFCLAAKTSSGTASSIPFRYNRRSCHCLPVSVKSDIRTSFIAFKPVQQCLSEAIFHLRLHIPLSLGTPA